MICDFQSFSFSSLLPLFGNIYFAHTLCRKKKQTTKPLVASRSQKQKKNHRKQHAVVVTCISKTTKSEKKKPHLAGCPIGIPGASAGLTVLDGCPTG